MELYGVHTRLHNMTCLSSERYCLRRLFEDMHGSALHMSTLLVGYLLVAGLQSHTTCYEILLPGFVL